MPLQQIQRQILPAYAEQFQAESVWPLARRRSLGPCRYWKLETEEGPFCLRRWPENEPTRERLQFQQAILWHCVCEGVDFVPLPFETLENKGFVEYAGCFWEILPWLEGDSREDDELFSPFAASEELSGDHGEFRATGHEAEEKARRAENAMDALARFHQAAAYFPLPNAPIATSPKSSLLLTCWKDWTSGRFDILHHALAQREQQPVSPGERRLLRCGRRLLDHAVRETGSGMILCGRAARLAVPVQAIHGDADLRHFRFESDRVCGLLDFRTICVDNIAVDIAALLGSLTGGDAALWIRGIRAYQAVRPLEDNERFLLSVFDRALALLDGLDQLRQFYLEGRILTDSQIDETARRLENAERRRNDADQNRRSA